MTEKEQFVLNTYEITENGEVFSTLRGTRKQLKFRTDKDGYFDTALIYDEKGNRQPFRIHRLVALKYLPEIKDYNVVNHLDLNKQNNHISNLKWSTVQLNTQHGYDNSAYLNIKKIKVTESDGTVKIFPSESHVSRYYNYANPSCVNALVKRAKPLNKGKRKGFIFEYAEESVTTIERNTDTVIGV